MIYIQTPTKKMRVAADIVIYTAGMEVCRIPTNNIYFYTKEKTIPYVGGGTLTLPDTVTLYADIDKVSHYKKPRLLSRKIFKCNNALYIPQEILNIYPSDNNMLYFHCWADVIFNGGIKRRTLLQNKLYCE